MARNAIRETSVMISDFLLPSMNQSSHQEENRRGLTLMFSGLLELCTKHSLAMRFSVMSMGFKCVERVFTSIRQLEQDGISVMPDGGGYDAKPAIACLLQVGSVSMPDQVFLVEACDCLVSFFMQDTMPSLSFHCECDTMPIQYGYDVGCDMGYNAKPIIACLVRCI